MSKRLRVKQSKSISDIDRKKNDSIINQDNNENWEEAEESAS